MAAHSGPVKPETQKLHDSKGIERQRRRAACRQQFVIFRPK